MKNERITPCFLFPQPCVGKKSCLTCGEKMLQHSSEALKILGGVGLFFSFTEVSSDHMLCGPHVNATEKLETGDLNFFCVLSF